MAKRRVKGEGSVYRRGDGRVVGEYEDANGRRRYVSGKTRPEAVACYKDLIGTAPPSAPSTASSTASP